MKSAIKIIFIAIGFVGILTGFVIAAENEYPSGIEGIKAASVPPPGFYYKMYNVLYNADTMTDQNGNESNIDFDLTLFVNAHRFLWVSKSKILGGNYAADVIVPALNVDLQIGAAGVDDSKFGIGDICIEPFVLAWHGSRYDAASALAVYAPTGEYDKTEPASIGKDMWTFMATLGGTYYFDQAKTWSASILGRYEIHGEKNDLDWDPGDDFHFEWGIGKTIGKIWDVGLTGYCQWQVTDDTGQDKQRIDKDQVYAIGPEMSVFIPPFKLFVSLRSQWEFEAKERSEGNFTTLTFTKIF
ncbi:transporter [Desulfococcaceae bacterium HSG9]|nr:transporter [Desulfococcaceae bacterium HSG9]